MKSAQISTNIFRACIAIVLSAQARALTPAEQADAFTARGLAAEQRQNLIAAGNCYTLALRVIPGHRVAQTRLAELGAKYPGLLGKFNLPLSPAETERRAKETVIKHVELRESTPKEAFAFLEKNSGIKVFYTSDNRVQKRITLSLSNVPVAQVLTFLTNMADLAFRYEKDGIRLFEKANAAAAPALPLPGKPAAATDNQAALTAPVTPVAAPSAAQRAVAIVSASHCCANDTVDALNDGKEPSGSGDRSIPRFTWWDHRQSLEWVQYDFATPQSIEGCSVYWYTHDGRIDGRVNVPAFWKVLFLDEAGNWMPVGTLPPPPSPDSWNICRFAPVRTKGLRIAAQLGGNPAGILEWKIIPSSLQKPPPVPQPAELWLDDLIPFAAKVGFGTYKVNHVNFMGESNAEVLVDGKPCEHFLFAHAASTVSFIVPSGYSRFSAVGIGPKGRGRNEVSWKYEVLADGKRVYQSEQLDSYPDGKVVIEVALPQNIRTLTLVTDECGAKNADHSIWANPKLLLPPLSAETKSKIDQLETQFKTACATRVEPAYAQAVQLLQMKYKAAVQRALDAAMRTADNAAVGALQQEIRLLKDGGSVPDTDPAGTPPALATLHTAYRAEAAAAAVTRDSQLQPLYNGYDAMLASLAGSLAGKPAEIAAVNAVRTRLASTRPSTQKPNPPSKPTQ